MTIRFASASLFALASIGLPAIVWGGDRVLIMAIGDYPNHPIPGARFDAENGKELARKMGFDVTRARVLQNKQLTRIGVQTEIERVVTDTAKGDRVFLYFSGYGDRYLENGQCVQSLVAQDSQHVSSEFIQTQLEQLKNMASQAVIVLDVGHTAGNVGTSNPAGKPGATTLTSKTWPARTGETCADPVLITQGVKNRGLGRTQQQNYLFINAAADSETAADDAGKGGVATVSLLNCLNQGVVDRDNSGSISAQELAACAQGKIDAHVNAIAQRFPTPHLSLAGNRDMPTDARIAPMVAAAGADTPAINALALLGDLKNRADGRWSFNAWAPATVPLGQSYRIQYESAQQGYVYVLYVGSDGKDIGQLYPRPGMHELRPAGSGNVVTLRSEPPLGDNHFAVIFSNRPRNFSALFEAGGNPIAATQRIAQELACELKPSNASSGAVGNNCKTRNASIVMDNPLPDAAIDGYAAALFKVQGY